MNEENKRVIPLFATPIYEEIFEDNNLDLVQQEIKSALELTTFKERDQRLGHLICEDDFNGDWISETKCTKFDWMINDALGRYCQTISIDPEQVNYTRHSWINKFDTGSFAHIHEHGESHISGVYYYQTTGYDGNLFFETPVVQTKQTRVWQIASTRIFRPSCNGGLILFPGWLRHGVTENFKPDTRISISFNINIVGNFKTLSPCEKKIST